MTETFDPATSIPGHPYLAPTPHLHNIAFSQDRRYAVSPVDGAQEDDGQISCFCGYSDDDGNTVGCDDCNRWNHIICYYPEYEGRDLPADLQHFCVECRPRPVDKDAANSRQRAKREQQDVFANGAKRPAAKSHKKKVKEPVAYTNGWPVDKIRQDRNSASPRDQPPPAKRPKTSHRPSDSISNGPNRGHARKRTTTHASHRRSVSQSPETPIELYSPEFFRCYGEDEWNVTRANLHNDIGVTNALSEWLRAPEDSFRETHGLDKSQVLSRWDGELDDIPGKAQVRILPQQDESYRDVNGNAPVWKSVSVDEPVPSGAYIGELKGHVGFKDEYKADPANRWPLLRHPEPFVFFHPLLPIYVDARNEGTELRYIRRSCQPNADLRVLVTDATDYRFCFMAIEQIDPGTEIAVGWDTAETLPEKIHGVQNSPLSTRDMDMLSTWVSTVLSNCGPCACNRPPTECAMSRFDRRVAVPSYEEEAQPVKMPKGRKKKAGQHISPLNTHAFNSRSGSEARKIEPDDEPTDSRSTSGSGGRDSESRDITPNTHYSANGSTTMPELSARERKKLEKEEEMFKRQAEEENGKARKKRSSAGSALNTPNPGTSKQLGFSNQRNTSADASTSRPVGLPASKTANGNSKRPRGAAGQKVPTKVVYKTVPRPKPLYVDQASQCDMTDQGIQQGSVMSPPSPRLKFVSNQQRLLNRLACRNARLENERAELKAAKTSSASAGAPARQSPPGRPDSPQSQTSKDAVVEAEPRITEHPQPEDVPMEDVPEDQEAVPEQASEGSMSPTGNASTSHPPADPPAPPWPVDIPASLEAPSPAAHSNKPEMHVEMPPPQTNPFGAPPSLSAGVGQSLTGACAQSPASTTGSTPFFSPSVSSAMAQSPMKTKKMSLSEYSKRHKPKEKTQGDIKGDRESSPASATSGPGLPPLQHSSSSEERKAGDHLGAAVEEDTKMEDVGPQPS
ncbi:hypothetical protein B0A50_02278 [Salinomyces thailandicus]|uniref:SET domain-containing protein n=1 Tax=Salinomyces thailandicus TaxID=706561 RepID=A0A4U0U830_9PEZI|nr:hypothetical protein B0A50_02278 [Salinomyces thailandica]